MNGSTVFGGIVQGNDLALHQAAVINQASGVSAMPLLNLNHIMSKEEINFQEAMMLNSLRPGSMGMGQNQLAVNNFLQRYEWEEIDSVVRDVVRTELNVVQDFMSAGLIQPLGGLGTILSTYEQLTDMDGANIDMAGTTEEGQDSAGFSPTSVPIPIIHKGFHINIRKLDASRRLGDALDTTNVRVAMRKVRDAAEALVMNGTGAPTVGTDTIEGLTNKTGRISDTASNFGGGDFGTVGNAYGAINGMIGQLKAAGFHGPYGCYVSRTQNQQLNLRYADGSGQTDRTAILQNLGSDGLRYIKGSDVLADGNVVVVQLTKDVVDLAVALQPVVIMWESKGGLITHYKVMWAMAPRVKGNSTTKVGVAHATGA